MNSNSNSNRSGLNELRQFSRRQRDRQRERRTASPPRAASVAVTRDQPAGGRQHTAPCGVLLLDLLQKEYIKQFYFEKGSGGGGATHTAAAGYDGVVRVAIHLG